jgi:cysteine desulfurase
MVAWLEQAPAADPGRVHTEGRMVRAALEEARDQVAALFSVRPRQVVLTSGGTEAINAAVWGATRADPGPVACSDVEHSAVRDASRRSAPVVTIAVDGSGRIEPAAVEDALERCRPSPRPPPALVHCQWANHEVGTVQPVADVVEHCRANGLPSTSTPSPPPATSPVDIGALGADLVSVSAHKLGGPTGASAPSSSAGASGSSRSWSGRAGAGPAGRTRERGRGHRLRGRGREAHRRPGALDGEAAAARARTERLAPWRRRSRG